MAAPAAGNVRTTTGGIAPACAGMTAVRRIVTILLAVIVLVLAGGWLLLAAPFLGTWRAGFVQGQLDKAGLEALQLRGPVSIRPGRTVHVVAEDLALGVEGAAATVARLEADLSLADLLRRKADPDRIVLSGTTVQVIRGADGKTAVTAAAAAEGDGGAAKGPPDPDAILAALAGRTVSLRDTRLMFEDKASNFAFDTQLATLEMAGGGDGAPVTLAGEGSVNGQPMLLDAAITPDAPLAATITSGGTVLKFTGADGSKGLSGGLSGAISMTSADLGQTLTILQLRPDLHGTAEARAVLGATADGSIEMTGIDVSLALDGGQTAHITGSLGDLRKLDNTDITIDASLYPPGKEPPTAEVVKDLRLTAVSMTAKGPLRGDTRRSMSIVTNGFQIDTAGVGPAPVTLAGIARSPDGDLVVGDLEIRIGPATSPWLVMDGHVADLLQLSGLALDGNLKLPLSTVVGSLGALPADLGGLTGTFKVSGAWGDLSLGDIDVHSADSDLWSLSLSGGVKSFTPIDGVDLKLDASVQAAATLSALGQEPVDVAPFEVQMDARSSDSTGTVTAEMTAQLGETRLDVSLSANNRGEGQVVRGRVHSDVVRISDLRDGVLVGKGIASAVDGTHPAEGQVRPRPAPRPIGPTAPKPRPKQVAPADNLRGITIGLFDKQRLLRYGDVQIDLSFGQIDGKSDVNAVTAALVINGGQARFGPLKFDYNGASFDIAADIDANTAPEVVHLKGSTGGWNFGDVLRALKVKMPASGTLDAEFDLSGAHDSLAAFKDSLEGSATVRMRNGTIATSLLDLAGLGVIPWLFSEGRRDKEAHITCLRAPLSFRSGVISTRESVVETREVQLVAFGQINLPARTIDISGQPRRIGKPLSRSPWPFTLSGSLSHPKVKVKDGPSRLRRTDGANTMPARRVPCVPDILQLK